MPVHRIAQGDHCGNQERAIVGVAAMIAALAAVGVEYKESKDE